MITQCTIPDIYSIELGLLENGFENVLHGLMSDGQTHLGNLKAKGTSPP
jgi:hypothetical protein